MLFFVAGCSYLLKFLVNIVVCCDGVLGEWKMRDLLFFFFFWVLGSVYGMVSGILVFFFLEFLWLLKKFPTKWKERTNSVWVTTLISHFYCLKCFKNLWRTRRTSFLPKKMKSKKCLDAKKMQEKGRKSWISYFLGNHDLRGRTIII